jgi:glycerophosphoryl diester phosphodiesterase
MTTRSPRLKWHKLRQRRDDPPFLRANLAAGLACGAAMEVDLSATADGDFVCVHDTTLDRETTGTGMVGDWSKEALKKLRQRAADGTPTDQPLLFLHDIVEAIRRLGRRPAGLVQLDIKEPSERLDDALLARLRMQLDNQAPAFVIGSCDARLVDRLRTALPGMALGFDPYDLYALRKPVDQAGLEALAAETLALAPEVRFYYLHVDMVLRGLDLGINLVERVRRPSAEIDVWTLGADQSGIAADLCRVVEAGADQITTYDPAILSAMLKDCA